MIKTFLAAIFLISLCIPSSAQTTLQKSIIHDGIKRDYTIYIPAIYNPAKKTPLLFNLHGYGSRGSSQMIYADFRLVADTANFILVVPEGTFSAGKQYWNVGLISSSVDDVGFLTSLIDSISFQYTIDAERVYSTGMSNGGFMSYLLACKTDRFAAIASVAGSMTNSRFNDCTPSKPTPVMEIHGTADAVVPYNGSGGIKSVNDIMQRWITVNKCDPTPVIKNIPDINTADVATAEHYVYISSAGANVELYKVNNGGHTWPGSPIIVGTTCQDFSAVTEIWNFLKRQSLMTTDVENLEEKTEDIDIYPNPATNQLQIQYIKSEILNVQIFSPDGKLLLKTANSDRIDIEQFPAGMYFIHIETKAKIFKRRFIKN